MTNTFSQGFTTECYLDGTLRKRTWPNGVSETRSYNPRGFLSQIQINQPGGGTLNQYNYKYGYNDANPADYDGTGRIRREVDQFNQTHAFFYNDLYELIGESAPPLGPGSLVYPYDVNYTYDLNGNRTSRSQGSATDYYGVDAADRLIWVNRGMNIAPTSLQASPYTLNYYNHNDMLGGRDRRDNNNVQQTLWFWWDGDDHLRKATTLQDPNASPFFLANYNADGIRTSKDDTRTGVLQHNDFSWSPYGLLWSSNPNTVYTPGFGHRSNGINSFYQVDWLGSTRYVTDITGTSVLAAQSYDAWGHRDVQPPGSPNHPTDMQFAGGWGYQTEWSNGANEPGLGLDYLQQRYYDPGVGRFISPDRMGFAGGPNLYTYGSSDPVNSIDPTGEAPNLRRDLGDDGWKVLQDALKGGWEYEQVPGAPHPHTIWRAASNGGKVTVHLPSKHGSWGPDLKARVKREIREGEAKACPSDADLSALLNQTILDEIDILPPSLLDPQGTSTPAIAPPGGKPWWTALEPPSLEDLKQAGGWAALYIVVSEGSRFLFPPRNLIPVW